jgi:hypothetical protein
MSQDLDSLRSELRSLRQQIDRIDELERQIDKMANDSSYMLVQKEKNVDTDNGDKSLVEIPASDNLRETTNNLTGNDLVADDFLGSWPMFGSDFRMKVGGYVKIDMLYDIDGTTDKTQFLMSTIPVEGSPEYSNNGYFYFMAKETRFNIDVRRITSKGLPLRLFVEGDFWASGNQFRLRHAYVVAGDFLVGQTWTTLSFLESLPFLIDFGAGDALFGGRAPQIRYQKKVSDAWKLYAGIEMLSFVGIENPNNFGGEESVEFPLLAFRADYKWKTGLLLLGTSAAQLYWDGGATGPDARALQYDFIVGGRQYIGKNNYATWNVSYGVGSGENIMAFEGSDANAVLNEDGELVAMPAFAFVLGFVHKWNEKFSSNLSYAYGWLDTPASRSPEALKKGGIGHVNLIYSPVKKFSTGIEYMWGAQRTTDDSFGKAGRIQAMVKFDF